MHIRALVERLIASLGRLLLWVALLSTGAVFGFQVALRIACHRKPIPMPQLFANYLEHPLRMVYRNPREMLTQFGVTEGEALLDLGCGKGTFTIEAARLVGTVGIVHAVDIQPALVSQAEERINRLELAKQVRFHTANAQTIPLADNSLDVVLLISTLGEIDDPLTAIDEIHRVLKPTGRLVLSEEILDPGYVSSQTARRWVEDAGFDLASKRGNPLCYTHLYLPKLTYVS